MKPHILPRKSANDAFTMALCVKHSESVTVKGNPESSNDDQSKPPVIGGEKDETHKINPGLR